VSVDANEMKMSSSFVLRADKLWKSRDDMMTLTKQGPWSMVGFLWGVLKREEDGCILTF
jgi:hypothetical protein